MFCCSVKKKKKKKKKKNQALEISGVHFMSRNPLYQELVFDLNEILLHINAIKLTLDVDYVC